MNISNKRIIRVNAKEKKDTSPSDTLMPLEKPGEASSGGRVVSPLSFNLRKLAVLNDLSKMRYATAKMIAKNQDADSKLIGSLMNKYRRFGYVAVCRELIQKRGRPIFLYCLTEKGERVLAKMKDLIERGLPPAPQKYKLEEWGVK